MAQQGPLNPSPGVNNLLGLVLTMYPPIAGYVDTGEPAATTVTTTTTVNAVFPVNGVGSQPKVNRGSFGVIVGAVGTQTTVGPITITVADGTTGTTNSEVVEVIPAFPSAKGGSVIRQFASSLAAGSDAANGPLANVVALQAAVVISGTTPTCQVKIVAVGTP